MGGVLEGAQIGLHDLSRAGVRARARIGAVGACVETVVSCKGGSVERVFDDAGHAN